MIDKKLAKKYKLLKREYKELNKKYDRLKTRAGSVEKIIERRNPPVLAALLFLSIGAIGLFYFKTSIPIELGLIGFAIDLIWETLGTQKGRWKYKKSGIFMIGKVPIEIPFLMFSVGMAGSTLILSLLMFF